MPNPCTTDIDNARKIVDEFRIWGALAKYAGWGDLIIRANADQRAFLLNDFPVPAALRAVLELEIRDRMVGFVEELEGLGFDVSEITKSLPSLPSAWRIGEARDRWAARFRDADLDQIGYAYQEIADLHPLAAVLLAEIEVAP